MRGLGTTRIKPFTNWLIPEIVCSAIRLFKQPTNSTLMLGYEGWFKHFLCKVGPWNSNNIYSIRFCCSKEFAPVKILNMAWHIMIGKNKELFYSKKHTLWEFSTTFMNISKNLLYQELRICFSQTVVKMSFVFVQNVCMKRADCT